MGNNKTFIIKGQSGGGELQAIDEGKGIGYRLKDSDPANYGNIGKGAIDFSKSNLESTTRGATGENSFTKGNNTTASGLDSNAEGAYTTASGMASHAEGISTLSSGLFSHAEGNNTTANGYYSHSEGRQTTANGRVSHAEGEYTIADGNISHTEGSGTTASATASHAQGVGSFARAFGEHSGGIYGTDYTTNSPIFNGFDGRDRLVNYGNGSDDANRSDAFTIYKNGAVRIYRNELSGITNTNKEGMLIYDSGNNNRPTIHDGSNWEGLAYQSELGSLEVIDEGNGIGYRLRGKNPSNHEPIGLGSIDLLTIYDANLVSGARGTASFAAGADNLSDGFFAVTFGYLNKALANYSVAFGYDNEVSGENSVIFGYGNIITGDNSVAFGKGNVVNNFLSLSSGNDNINSGAGSSTLGVRCIARSASETVVGANSYDITAVNSSDNDSRDVVFHVGASNIQSNRRSQLMVFKSGMIKYTPINVKNLTINPNVPNGVEGAFGLDNQNNNRPTIHNGTDWKELAYVHEVIENLSPSTSQEIDLKTEQDVFLNLTDDLDISFINPPSQGKTITCKLHINYNNTPRIVNLPEGSNVEVYGDTLGSDPSKKYLIIVDISNRSSVGVYYTIRVMKSQ